MKFRREILRNIYNYLFFTNLFFQCSRLESFTWTIRDYGIEEEFEADLYEGGEENIEEVDERYQGDSLQSKN